MDNTYGPCCVCEEVVPYHSGPRWLWVDKECKRFCFCKDCWANIEDHVLGLLMRAWTPMGTRRGEGAKNQTLHGLVKEEILDEVMTPKFMDKLDRICEKARDENGTG